MLVIQGDKNYYNAKYSPNKTRIMTISGNNKNEGDLIIVFDSNTGNQIIEIISIQTINTDYFK